MENSNSRTDIEESTSEDASSSSSMFCLSDEIKWDVKSKNKNEVEPVDSVISVDSGECSDHEITSYRRQRRDVDYKKLYNVSTLNQCLCGLVHFFAS